MIKFDSFHHQGSQRSYEGPGPCRVSYWTCLFYSCECRLVLTFLLFMGKMFALNWIYFPGWWWAWEREALIQWRGLYHSLACRLHGHISSLRFEHFHTALTVFSEQWIWRSIPAIILPLLRLRQQQQQQQFSPSYAAPFTDAAPQPSCCCPCSRTCPCRRQMRPAMSPSNEYYNMHDMYNRILGFFQ